MKSKNTCGWLILAFVFAVFPAKTAFTGQSTAIAPGNCISRQWVFFKDKGQEGDLSKMDTKADAASLLSSRSLHRRERMGIAIDEYDQPVCKSYIQRIDQIGIGIRYVSKWLNAVSVMIDLEQQHFVRSLPFVKDIRPVLTLTRPPEKIQQIRIPQENRTTESFYGFSYNQLNQINLIALHKLGFTGQGIFISVFDTGFLLSHQAFDSLIADDRLIATHDFINGDHNVEDGDDIQRIHGTSVFSCLSACLPGTMIGGAYGAEFALAKTEIQQSEIRIEEDNWVAAAEWSDSLGVDIISSSLGYNQWYSYDDMDGNTAVTTIAADIAASRGILVVNAVGNEGGGSWKYMISPADADSTLAIGAVDSMGIRTDFSSIGPTFDGRIKPDAVALGRDVYCALSQTQNSFGISTGTSFSTPLAASAAALVLQASQEKPTPIDIIESIRSYSSRAQNPDTLYGWGIVNGFRASGAFRILTPSQLLFAGGEQFNIALKIIGSDGPRSGDSLELTISPENGIVVMENFHEQSEGLYVASMSTTQIPGNYLIEVRDITVDIADSVFLNISETPLDYSLYFRNYPNPFLNATNFTFYLPDPAETKISIHTVSGEKIRQLDLPAASTHRGINDIPWNADNDNGNEIAAGIYICMIKTPWYRNFTKAVRIK